MISVSDCAALERPKWDTPNHYMRGPRYRNRMKRDAVEQGNSPVPAAEPREPQSLEPEALL